MHASVPLDTKRSISTCGPASRTLPITPIQRAGIAADAVEDVLMGCANPEGATGSNIARQIALMADLPITVSGMTINRFCSSGLQTIAMASQRVIAGEGAVPGAGLAAAPGFPAGVAIRSKHRGRPRGREAGA